MSGYRYQLWFPTFKKLGAVVDIGSKWDAQGVVEILLKEDSSLGYLYLVRGTGFLKNYTSSKLKKTIRFR